MLPHFGEYGTPEHNQRVRAFHRAQVTFRRQFHWPTPARKRRSFSMLFVFEECSMVAIPSNLDALVRTVYIPGPLLKGNHAGFDSSTAEGQAEKSR